MPTLRDLVQLNNPLLELTSLKSTFSNVQFFYLKFLDFKSIVWIYFLPRKIQTYDFVIIYSMKVKLRTSIRFDQNLGFYAGLIFVVFIVKLFIAPHLSIWQILKITIYSLFWL